MTWIKYDSEGRPITSQGSFALTLSGDTGTDEFVSNNNTIEFAGGTGTETVMSSPRTITVNDVWDYEEILGSSSAFDVTLNTISTWSINVKTIEMELLLRGSVSATQDTIYVLLNNDTTLTNYRRQVLAGAAGVSLVGTANDPLLGLTSASTSPVNSFGMYRVLINNPNSTNHIKAINNNGGAWFDAGNNLRKEQTFVIWNSTSAITRIQVRTDNHPTDLWVANSYMRLKFIR